MERTRSEISGAQEGRAQALVVGGSGRCKTKCHGDVLDGLRVVFCDDSDREVGAGCDGTWYGESGYAGRGEGAEEGN